MSNKKTSKQQQEQEEDISKIKWFHCWVCTFLLKHWKTEPSEYINLRHVDWKPPTHLTGGQKLN